MIVLTHLFEDEDGELETVVTPMYDDSIVSTLVDILDSKGMVYCLDNEHGIVDPHDYR